MTRKHFEVVAAVMRSRIEFHTRNDDVTSVTALEWTAEDFADTFAAENPRFDRARFLKACGVTR